MKRSDTADVAVTAAAVVLMVAGAVMIFTGPSNAIAFPIIAIGIALTVVAQADKRRRNHNLT